MSPEALAEHAPNPPPPRAATPTARHPSGPTLPYPQSAGRALSPDGLSGRVRVNAPTFVPQGSKQNAEAVNSLGREGWEAIKPGVDYPASQRREAESRKCADLGRQVRGETGIPLLHFHREYEGQGGGWLLPRQSCCPHPVRCFFALHLCQNPDWARWEFYF